MRASRREALALAGALAAPGVAAAQPTASVAEADRILKRYVGFGDKASGGAGDNACGEWLIEELTAAGYRCERHRFDAPAYEGPEPTLQAGEATARLIPQAIVVPTGGEGVTGPLHLLRDAPAPRGSIALIELPFARWSTVLGEPQRRIRQALQDGAAGVVVITTGPTGEACALNAPSGAALFDRPVAVLAPRDARPFVQAAGRGATATLRIPGRSIRRTSFNVTAEAPRQAGRKWLVLSTPRSGWFGCAGERGPGLAAWLMLAKWARAARLPVNIALIATSGHEYEYQGGELFIEHEAPKPAETALWVHFGANVAARDWHERQPLEPLPSVDPQRYLLASAPLLPSARAAFAGLPGLERVYPADPAQAAGELGSILKAGYPTAMGIFGTHRFHHTRADDMRCVSGAFVAPVAAAFQKVIGAALRG